MKKSIKDNAYQSKIAHKMMDIARERNYDLHKLFPYELTKINSLFKKYGISNKQTSKSELVEELEKKNWNGKYIRYVQFK